MYAPSRQSPRHSYRRVSGPIKRRKYIKYLRWFISIFLVLLILIASLLATLNFYLANAYAGTDKTVAQILVFPTKLPHLISVQLNTFDSRGHISEQINCYSKQGDILTLQGDIIKFAPILNTIGFHTYYKLTRIEGCYSSFSQLETAHKPNSFILNGGEENFFTTLQGSNWISPLVEVMHSRPISIIVQTSLTLGPKTYNVYTSQNGFYAAIPK